MKKVKIVFGDSISSYDDYSTQIIRDSITDWEEISDEDYAFLRSNLSYIVNAGYHNWTPLLVVQDEKPVSVRIESIKKAIAERKKMLEKNRLEAEEKRKARELKKALKAKLSKEELFNQLKAELGK